MGLRRVDWSESYLTGHHQIDDDHRYIFGLLGKVGQAVITDRSHECITSVLNQLLDYTQTHFRDEENLMKECNYPDYTLHLQSHMQLLDSVEDMLDENRRGITVFGRPLYLFLENWGYAAYYSRRYKVWKMDESITKEVWVA